MKKTFVCSALLTAIIVLVLTLQRLQIPNIGIADNDQAEITKQRELFKETLKKAETGDPNAQYELGYMYAIGKGVTESEDEAKKWLSMSAKQGHVKSICRLILMNEKSEVIAQDEIDAVKSLTQMAEQGDVESQVILSKMYYRGWGIEKNYKEAFGWATKAAEKDNAEAQLGLGIMFAFGEGVPRNDEEVVRLFTRAVEQGYSRAQYNLGVMYYEGRGVAQDYKEAVKWYTKAAEQGFADAQYNLGLMYENGQGVDWDDKEAIRLYTKAADQRRDRAQNKMGWMYANGRGVQQSYKEAIKWYTKAAEQEYALAQYNLGEMYDKGEGVPQNFEEAVSWYTKAAEQGHAYSQFNLGSKYLYAQGVTVNYIEAYKWFNLAASQGVEQAAKNRDILNMKMSEEQVAEAQRLSKEFTPKNKEAFASNMDTAEKKQTSRNGTGFFITADGYLLTAYHVVKSAASIQVWTEKKLSPARVIHVDEANDIALLKVEGTGFDALAVQSSRDVKVGQEIFTMGFPNIQLQGTEAKYTQGNISSLSGIGDDPRLFQISAAVQPGNSGGPLLDADGRVVGVVVSKLDEIATAKETGSLPQNVNYAMKSSFVLSFLESLPELNGKLAEPKKAGLVRTEIVEKTGKAVVMVVCY